MWLPYGVAALVPTADSKSFQETNSLARELEQTRGHFAFLSISLSLSPSRACVPLPGPSAWATPPRPPFPPSGSRLKEEHWQRIQHGWHTQWRPAVCKGWGVVVGCALVHVRSVPAAPLRNSVAAISMALSSASLAPVGVGERKNNRALAHTASPPVLPGAFSFPRRRCCLATPTPLSSRDCGAHERRSHVRARSRGPLQARRRDYPSRRRPRHHPGKPADSPPDSPSPLPSLSLGGGPRVAGHPGL